MHFHPFLHMLLHFLLSFVHLPIVQGHPFERVGPGPGPEPEMAMAMAKRTDGDDYGPRMVMGPSVAYRTCDQEGYFNPDRWEESGAAQSYLKWSILVNKTSSAWLNRQSEPNFFLRDVLNWANLDCGITYKGCVGMPTCDDILTRTQNETTARRIYFIILSMNNLNLISGVVNEQSVPAQANVASMVANMANTFFWKHNDAVERKCKLKMNVMKAMLASIMSGAFVLAPFIGVGVVAIGAAVDAETIAVSAELVAIDSAILAEKSVAQEVAAVEESVIAAEEKAVAESNLDTFRREGGLDGPASGTGSEPGSGTGLEPEPGSGSEPGSETNTGVTSDQEPVAPEGLPNTDTKPSVKWVDKERKFTEQVRLQKKVQIARERMIVKQGEKEGRERMATEDRMRAIVDRTASTSAWKHVEDLKGEKWDQPKPWQFSMYYPRAGRLLNKFLSHRYTNAALSFQGAPMTIGGNDAESKFCDKYPNVPAAAQKAHELQLDTDIREGSMNFRKHVQSDITLINSGVGFGENYTFPPFSNTVLSNQLFSGYYIKLAPIDHLRFVEEPSRIEADITNHFKNALISAMLKEELCFLACTRKNSGFEPAPDMTSSQFEPVPGTVCQTQCWRNWKIGKMVELYGLYDLLKIDNDWNVSLQDFVTQSFKHWQEHRFDQQDQNLFPTVSELFSGKSSTSSGSFLPVCYSDLIKPTDMSNEKQMHQLPCLCGDERGNETQLFYKEAGFEKWVGNADGNGLANLCQNTMGDNGVPPVTAYLELCDDGWHFPLNYERGTTLHKGADDQCEKIRDLRDTMMDLGHDDRTINCRICFDTPVGILIKQSQTVSITHMSTRSYYSFKGACDKYDQDPKTSCLY